MRKLICLFLLAGALGACQTVEERRAHFDALDDTTCLGYGAKPGTEPYIKCRTDLARNRAIENQPRAPVVVGGWGWGYSWGSPWYGPGPYCRPTPFGLRCY